MMIEITSPCEGVNTRPPRNIPESDCGIKTCGGQDEVHVRIVGAWACGTPFDGVNLFLMSLQIVDTRLSVHCPNLRL